MPVQKYPGTAPKKRRLPRKIRIILKVLLLTTVAFFLTGTGIVTAMVFGYLRDVPPFDPEMLYTVETSYLYDNMGRKITGLHEEQNRVVVALDDIPEHVRQAFIAVEDERFFRHFGIDIIGSIRALLVNLRYRAIVQGASTITQQLARNAFLHPGQTLERKIQEMWLAIQMERHFSKDEILEMYLNRIYFGYGAYGVEAASQTYFGKSVGELSIAEAAMLAGILNAPNHHNPFASEEEAVEQKISALNNMRRLNFITEEQYNEAAAKTMIYGEPPTVEYPFPHFVDYVLHHELIEILSAMPQFGSREEAYRAIYTGGLRIYTTLDRELQGHVEAVLNRDDLYPRTIYVEMERVREAIRQLPPDRPEISLPAAVLNELIDEENGIPQPQAAIVAANPQTGELRALVGGRRYSRKRNQVLRFISLRQPGSAIKSIIAYAPAFEEGTLAGAGSTIDDAPYILGDWAPENFDYRFRGLITARDALVYSYNLPAVRVFEELTAPVGANYAERMGITTFTPIDKEILGTTLGGVTHGVTALDMAQAYAVLANEGIKMDFHAVKRIEDREGNLIYEHQANPRQILSPQTTFLVNDILQDVVRRYVGRALNIDRPVAAKTGTTNNWRDVYLVAYTPNLVASFWMGFDEPRMGSIRQGWSFSTAFLREVFLEAFKTLPVEQFNRPSGIVQMEVCTKSGLLPTELCRAAGTVRTDYFLASHAPRLNCDLHVELQVCKVTGLLAGPFCPPDQIETKTFLNRPPYITTDARWRFGEPGRRPEDADLMPPAEQCDHGTGFTGERPSQPSSFTAQVQGNFINLSWEYDWNNIREFRLFRRGPDGQTRLLVSLDSFARSYQDFLLLEPGAQYSYFLFAVAIDGSHSLQAEAQITVAQQPGAPNKPSNFTASYSQNAVLLTWTDQNSPSEEFIIERKEGSGEFQFLASVPGHQLSYSDTDLTAGADYQYRITALLFGVNSGYALASISIPPPNGNGNGNSNNGQ